MHVGDEGGIEVCDEAGKVSVYIITKELVDGLENSFDEWRTLPT